MRKKHSVGFSLIELMIAVVVIGILAAIAMPAYTEHLRKTRRSGAMAALQQAANTMDRFRLQRNTYVGASIVNITTDRYTLAITASGLNTYTLRATPVPGDSQDGDGIIELDSSGARRWDENNTPGIWEPEENDWEQG